MDPDINRKRKLPTNNMMQETNTKLIPNENDILLGRGGKNHSHSGNQKLRTLAGVRWIEYCGSRPEGKTKIALNLMQQIESLQPPGRFLKKNSKTGEWEEVNFLNARAKVSQVLRDATDVHLGAMVAKKQKQDQNTGAAMAINKRKFELPKRIQAPPSFVALQEAARGKLTGALENFIPYPDTAAANRSYGIPPLPSMQHPASNARIETTATTTTKRPLIQCHQSSDLTQRKRQRHTNLQTLSSTSANTASSSIWFPTETVAGAEPSSSPPAPPPTLINQVSDQLKDLLKLRKAVDAELEEIHAAKQQQHHHIHQNPQNMSILGSGKCVHPLIDKDFSMTPSVVDQQQQCSYSSKKLPSSTTTIQEFIEPEGLPTLTRRVSSPVSYGEDEQQRNTDSQRNSNDVCDDLLLSADNNERFLDLVHDSVGEYVNAKTNLIRSIIVDNVVEQLLIETNITDGGTTASSSCLGRGQQQQRFNQQQISLRDKVERAMRAAIPQYRAKQSSLLNDQKSIFQAMVQQTTSQA